MNTPETLYHYTTYEALLSILKSRRLWATDISYLNDSQEFLYASRLVVDQIHLMKPNFDAVFKEALELLAQEIEKTKIPSFHVVCFSEHENQLSQWRAYASNGGVAIGFATNRLSTHAGESGFVLGRCEYDENQHHLRAGQFVSDCVLAFESALRKTPEARDPRKLLQIATGSVWTTFRNVAPFIKHPRFNEEAEWRLIFESSDLNVWKGKVHVRSAHGMLIPYVELPIEASRQPGRRPFGDFVLPIKEIVIGPTGNSHLVQKSLSAAFWQAKIDPVPFRPSNVPLRSSW